MRIAMIFRDLLVRAWGVNVTDDIRGSEMISEVKQRIDQRFGPGLV
jgi:hypothetical protein